MVEDKIILGIDPGTNVLGYGLIHVKGKKIALINFGIIQLAKLSTHPDKLKKIFERLDAVIKEYKPDEMAIEAPFFGKNVQSMLKLGRAQGVAIAAALSHKLSVVEYAPRKIKQSITGNGNASKEQVAAMLQQILKINQADMPKKMDATDGLAAAVCHYFQTSGPLAAKGNYKSWDSFLKNNPDRIR